MKIILTLFLTLTTICFYGQTEHTKYITISKKFLDGDYRREIKIDLQTGVVYSRKKISKKYKLVKGIINDSTVAFLKDSLTYNYLNGIVKETAFDEVGYKIEFHSKDCLSIYPCYSEIKSIEFGSPHDQNNKALEKIIKIYVNLRIKAKI